jgi:hypothetical protein
MKKLLGCLWFAMLLCWIAGIPIIGKAYATDADEEDASSSVVAIDIYSFCLNLKVPQVLDNTKSLGYRKYQTQRIKGDMYIKWLDDGSFAIEFGNLKNSRFKVNGAYVTYKGYEDKEVVYTRYNYIGSNKTDAFKTPCLCFYLELEPSYAKGSNTEDNSFYILLAGTGSSTFKGKFGSRIATRLHGYAAGTQGCGCAAYSHKSPTRNATIVGPMDGVSDVVATFGSWSAKWTRRMMCGGISLLR